ncbi:MAG: hypothetical protein HXY49_10665 [Ignavibacteriaceae bacterium]|nr:hypothetical protein [Ignavibacteriaceae bacterium]
MKKLLYFVVLLIVFSNLSCSIYQTISNLSRLKFKLANVNSFTVSGIDISGKSSLQDFSPFDILKFTQAVAGGKFPVTFTLNVEAKNPNDGTGGYPRTDATLKSFPWRLLLDDKEMITGNIADAITVPGTGETTMIPLQISVDLLQVFKDKGYESLLNLALSLGGKGGSTTKLALFAKPTVSSPLGDITYPGELKIIDAAFSD